MTPKSITVSPVLLDNCWKQNGTNFFRLRLTIGGQRKFIKTNIVIHRDQIGRGGKIKDPYVRHRVEDVVRSVEEAAMNINTFALASMSPGQVVEFLERTLSGEFRLDFFQFAQTVLDKKSGSSRACYASAVRSFRAFVGEGPFDISQITSSLLRRWEQWLCERHGDRARAVSSYTAAMRYIHGRARAQYNNEELGYVPIKNPFQYYKPPVQVPAEHRDIDTVIIDEMLRRRKDLAGRERIGVDLFLISFALMGMNCPDLYYCSVPKDGVITYNRQKTKNKRHDRAKMCVRIENAVLPIIGEYAGTGGRLFNFSERYSDYKNLGKAANGGLKRFCERIGYGEGLNVYSARHTWSTVAYSLRIDTGVINDCLCHVDKNMKVTDIYINKDWSVMWDANASVLTRFDWDQ